MRARTRRPSGTRPRGRDHKGIQPTGARLANFYFSLKTIASASPGRGGKGDTGVEEEFPAPEKLTPSARPASAALRGEGRPRPCPRGCRTLGARRGARLPPAVTPVAAAGAVRALPLAQRRAGAGHGTAAGVSGTARPPTTAELEERWVARI